MKRKLKQEKIPPTSANLDEKGNKPSTSKRVKTTPNTSSVSTVPVLSQDIKGPKPKRRPGRRWSAEEDNVLRSLVEKNGSKHWKKIAEEFAKVSGTGRTDVQCLHRWNKCLKPGLVKGPWTKEEDQVIHDIILVHGVNNIRWSTIAKQLPGRLGKQVRERWINHLDPSISKKDWTSYEDKKLYTLQQELGNKWKLIAQMMPGRSENGVKNRWHSIKPTLSERIRMWEINNVTIESPDELTALTKKQEEISKAKKQLMTNGLNNFKYVHQTQVMSNGVQVPQGLYNNGLSDSQLVNMQMTHPMPQNLAGTKQDTDNQIPEQPPSIFHTNLVPGSHLPFPNSHQPVTSSQMHLGGNHIQQFSMGNQPSWVYKNGVPF